MFKYILGLINNELKFGLTQQASIRNNAGVMEVKNNGGSYSPVASTTSFTPLLDKFVVDLSIISTGQIILTSTPVSNTEDIKLNGVGLLKGSSDDYTISGTIVSFSAEVVAKLVVGDKIWAKYQIVS